MISITRRYRFSASHRLHVAALSEQENYRLFGKCNNPFGHGHDYVLSVTVTGDVDETSGLIIRTKDLDCLVESKVLRLMAHRNLNIDVPELADLVPTTENVVIVIANLLEAEWPDSFAGVNAKLWRVHLQETDRNGFEVLLNDAIRRPSLVRKQESVAVNV
jgi:6-pyruvoyltetrahydropterin/6-carboxytetrahydropterin synthase